MSARRGPLPRTFLTGVRIVSVARIKANQGGSVTLSTGWLLLSSGLLVLFGIRLVVPSLA
jgi:hypothetical protein